MWMEQTNSENPNGYGRGIIKVDVINNETVYLFLFYIIMKLFIC